MENYQMKKNVFLETVDTALSAIDASMLYEGVADFDLLLEEKKDLTDKIHELLQRREEINDLLKRHDELAVAKKFLLDIERELSEDNKGFIVE